MTFRPDGPSGPTGAERVPGAERSTGSQAVLWATSVTVRFGDLTALSQVDLQLETGQILGLIGPNGAGKTTMTNVLTGFQRPSTGSVSLGKQRVDGWAADRLARAGVSRTFQAVRPFGALSVRENVLAAASATGMPWPTAVRRSEALLDEWQLSHVATRTANSLSHGAERRLGIARALAGRPRFLLLDEPAAGMNESESDELTDTLRGIPDRHHCGVMVIEHDMRVIMRLCDKIQVLDHGFTIAEGRPTEIQSNPAVIEAYLGRGGS